MGVQNPLVLLCGFSLYFTVRLIEDKMNPMAIISLCFSDLKNQEDVDKTNDKGLSLSMIVVLCVTSLVAVAMICATVVVVVMYKKWAAKHDDRIVDRDIPPATKPGKPKVLKL